MIKQFLLSMIVILAACGSSTAGSADSASNIPSEQTNDLDNSKNQVNMRNNSAKLQQFADQGYVFDTFKTPSGREVSLIFIKHGSIAIDIDGYLVYIDPVTIYGNDFSKLPKADLLMVTHEHHDHFDKEALAELTSDDTRLIGSRRITELYGRGETMLPGDSKEISSQNFTITATPAYNISPDHLQFHPKERQDDGFLVDIDGFRIYVAGDTEDIPEMADLKDIDVAFLPVNQPYTMTPQQAIHATEMIRPKILYPYHYGDTDLSPLVEKFKEGPVEVRVRQLQ